MRTRVLSISRITHISVVATFLLSPTFAQPRGGCREVRTKSSNRLSYPIGER